MRKPSSLPLLLSILVLLLANACASLGVEPAKNFKDSALYAYATIDVLGKTATNALNAKTITSVDAEYILKTVVNTRLVVVAAETAYEAGDTADADSRLKFAESVLMELKTYLALRGAK